LTNKKYSELRTYLMRVSLPHKNNFHDLPHLKFVWNALNENYMSIVFNKLTRMSCALSPSKIKDEGLEKCKCSQFEFWV